MASSCALCNSLAVPDSYKCERSIDDYTCIAELCLRRTAVALNAVLGMYYKSKDTGEETDNSFVMVLNRKNHSVPILRLQRQHRILGLQRQHGL